MLVPSMLAKKRVTAKEIEVQAIKNVAFILVNKGQI